MKVVEESTDANTLPFVDKGVKMGVWSGEVER